MDDNFQLMMNLIRNMDDRINDVEKLLKLLVVNDLVDDIKDCIIQEDRLYDSEENLSIVTNINRKLKQYGLKISDVISIDGFSFFKIEVSNDLKIGIKEVLKINCDLSEFEGVELIYYFNKINGMLRKRLVEEEISFCIADKELHICSKK